MNVEAAQCYCKDHGLLRRRLRPCKCPAATKTTDTSPPQSVALHVKNLIGVRVVHSDETMYQELKRTESRDGPKDPRLVEPVQKYPVEAPIFSCRRRTWHLKTKGSRRKFCGSHSTPSEAGATIRTTAIQLFPAVASLIFLQTCFSASAEDAKYNIAFSYCSLFNISVSRFPFEHCLPWS